MFGVSGQSRIICPSAELSHGLFLSFCMWSAWADKTLPIVRLLCERRFYPYLLVGTTNKKWINPISCILIVFCVSMKIMTGTCCLCFSGQDGRESEGTEAPSAEAQRTEGREEEAQEAGRHHRRRCTEAQPQSLRRAVGCTHGQDLPQVSPDGRLSDVMSLILSLSMKNTNLTWFCKLLNLK